MSAYGRHKADKRLPLSLSALGGIADMAKADRNVA